MTEQKAGKPIGKRSRNVAPRKPGAGRPPKGYTYDPKSIHGKRDEARGRAAASMDDCVELWKKMVKAGLAALSEEQPPHAGVLTDWSAINRAAENLCDRGGMARKTELDIETADVPAKMFRLTTYRGKDGKRHELPRDPSGDSSPA